MTLVEQTLWTIGIASILMGLVVGLAYVHYRKYKADIKD